LFKVCPVAASRNISESSVHQEQVALNGQ